MMRVTASLWACYEDVPPGTAVRAHGLALDADIHANH